MDAVATTAQWMAAVRARETERPDRLFEDPLAEVLAGPEGFHLGQILERVEPERLEEFLRRAVQLRPAERVVPASNANQASGPVCKAARRGPRGCWPRSAR